MSDLPDSLDDGEEPRKVVKDPDNPEWEILPIIQPLDDTFEMIWNTIHTFGANVIGGYARYLCSPNPEPAEASDVDIFIDADNPGVNVMEKYNTLCVEFEKMFDNSHKGPLSTYFFNEDQSGISANVIIPRADENMVTFGNVYHVLSMFDFTVVRAAVKNPGECIVDPDFYEDEMHKQLVWKHINCPIAAVYRAIKYSKKGYHARPREVIKLFQDWSDRDTEYKEALILALQNNDPTEDEIMNLERLLWVD